MNWAGRAFIDLMESLGEWVDSFEILRGRIAAPPSLSFLMALILASIPSFSHSIIQLAYVSIVAALWGFALAGPRWIRFVRMSVVWAGFTLAIMIPKIVLTGSLDPLLVPIRVISSLLTLEATAALLGTESMVRGLGFLVPRLPESLNVMIGQISHYLRNMGWLILAKGSRVIGEGGSLRYGVLSLATSELLDGGRDRAFLVALARRSRIWDGGCERASRRDRSNITLIIAFILSFLPAVPLMGWFP